MTLYTITEPHPTVVKNHYTHAGRGGAGNYFRAPATTPASGIPTEPTVPTPSGPTRFHSGRGGAGNSHVAPKPPAMLFDEEYQRHAHIEAKAVGHVGRGGAGNVYDHKHPDATPSSSSSRKTSDASSHASSSSSGSGRSARILDRLGKTLSRNH